MRICQEHERDDVLGMQKPLKHTLLDAVLSDEVEDVNLLGLANAVCAIHSLQIGLRIPANE